MLSTEEFMARYLPMPKGNEVVTATLRMASEEMLNATNGRPFSSFTMEEAHVVMEANATLLIRLFATIPHIECQEHLNLVMNNVTNIYQQFMAAAVTLMRMFKERDGANPEPVNPLDELLRKLREAHQNEDEAMDD